MRAQLQVNCTKSNLPTIRDFVRNNLYALEIGGRLSDQIVLAIDEACCNSIVHQHNCNELETIELAMYMQEDDLCIELKDSGRAFAIDQFQPSSTEERIKTHNKGGMGILLIRSIMDNIEIDQYSDFHVFKFIKTIAK
ncbi:MAG: ATP-binding protein [Bacteroidia bacterium]